MSVTLFPIIQPAEELEVKEPALYKEVKWDYENNIPIFHYGEPVFVTGLEAVKVWAWKAIHTQRFYHDIYTWDYGCEINSLIGQTYSEELKLSEASRYLKECLLVNPYITDVTNIDISFEKDKLTINCIIITLYGEETINV